MRSALYYPHTTIRGVHLLKSSLLLWDHVHVIVPWPHYTPHYQNATAAEAFSVIGSCHYPSEDEKRQVHELVEDFVKRPLPPAFTYSSVGAEHEAYDIYPEKMLPGTAEILRNLGMAARGGRRNLRSSAATGLTLMNMIADCCAGNTLARITDQGAAYASLAGLLVEKPDAKLAIHESREQLIPVLIKMVDAKKFSLRALINLRKREESAPDGSQLRALRHRLLERIEEQARRLAVAGSALARESIEKEFEDDMKDDFRDLREALKAKATQTLGTKEVLTTVVSAVGSVATALVAPAFPIAAAASGVQGIVSVGGLLATKSKWVEERRKLLKDHATAYLYEAAGGLRW
jgi:hypothetical protein